MIKVTLEFTFKNDADYDKFIADIMGSEDNDYVQIPPCKIKVVEK